MLTYTRAMLPWLQRHGVATRTKNGIWKFDISPRNALDHSHTHVAQGREFRFPYPGDNRYFRNVHRRTRDYMIFRPGRAQLFPGNQMVYSPLYPVVSRSEIEDPYRLIRIDESGGYYRVFRGRTGRKHAERNRRRRDTKVPGAYQTFLRVVYNTYGRYSEWMEFADATGGTIARGGTLLDMAHALAWNEIIDQVYGTRARMLRRHIYSHPLYVLPVGLDALSRFWR